jgi:LPXTG-motif cell wall-anchored protein
MFSALAGAAMVVGAMVSPMTASAHEQTRDEVAISAAGPVYSYNLTSMCRPSVSEGSLRIRNGSPTSQAYMLELYGGSTFSGVAAPGDTLVTVPWSSSSDTWILTIDGQSKTKAIGNNPACEVPPTTLPPTTLPPTTLPTDTTAPVTTLPTDTTAPVTTLPTDTTAAATTTSQASEAPIPTATTVASAGPVPTTTGVAGDTGSLPATGTPSSPLLLIGLTMLGFGSVLSALARRSTQNG